LVSFAATGPTVTERPEIAVLAAPRSSDARSKRLVPSSACSFGAGAVAMVKSVTVTGGRALGQRQPAAMGDAAGQRLGVTLPPVIGKARLPSGLAVAGADGAAVIPSEVSA
jgi:hypothetical protein